MVAVAYRRTYGLCDASKQKRQSLTKRSTEFIETFNICDTTVESSFCNILPSQAIAPVMVINYWHLHPILTYPQIEPNTTKALSFTASSFIYPPFIHSSLTCYSQQPPIPSLNITSTKATIHSIINTHTQSCFTTNTAKNNLDT